MATIRISDVNVPSTGMAEEKRRDTQHRLTERAAGSRSIVAIISEVHQYTNLVQCYHEQNGGPIAGGRWIRLDEDPETIVRKWGLLEKGMKVTVILSGQGDINALAHVIAGKHQKVLGERTLANKVPRGLYAIFSPPGFPSTSSGEGPAMRGLKPLQRTPSKDSSNKKKQPPRLKKPEAYEEDPFEGGADALGIEPLNDGSTSLRAAVPQKVGKQYGKNS
jgi:hypothetical protein